MLFVKSSAKKIHTLDGNTELARTVDVMMAELRKFTS